MCCFVEEMLRESAVGRECSDATSLSLSRTLHRSARHAQSNSLRTPKGSPIARKHSESKDLFMIHPALLAEGNKSLRNRDPSGFL